MIHIAETLVTGSVEGFLTGTEAADLAEAMDALLRRHGPGRYDARRTNTMHVIPGHTSAEARSVYEPRGRLEVTTLPATVERILAGATRRAWPAITRVLPSVTTCRPWTYVEYGTGQHITPHVDSIAPDPEAWPRQVAGISVVIGNADSGGSFWVETTGEPELWSEHRACPEAGYAPAMRFARDGADNSSPWFRAMPRTRWCAQPAPGTALLYGSQLTHGTDPVVSGRARKFISWLVADPTRSRPSPSDHISRRGDISGNPRRVRGVSGGG